MTKAGPVQFTASMLAACTMAAAAHAGLPANCSNTGQPIFGCEAPQGGPAASTDTSLYAGVQIVFAKAGAAKAEPRFVVGARRIHVGTDDQARGVDVALRFGIEGGLHMDSAVLSVVGGANDRLANAGLGWSYEEAGWMTTVAAQTAHLRAGADYVFTLGAPTWFIEVNSAQTPKATKGAATCPKGLFLLPVGGTSFYDADPSVVVDGQSCFPPAG